MHYSYSTKSSIVAILFLLYSNIISADEWNAIPGIPNPGFGITNEAPNRPVNWSSDVLGFYYIDNTNINATDNSTYGNYLIPRKTIPNPLPAGAVVEVHGLYDRDAILNSLGTSDKPVYVKGISIEEPAIFSGKIDITGSYLTVENFISEAIVAEGKHRINIHEGNDHITLRNGELSGEGSTGSNATIEIGSWSYKGTEKASNILIYKMNIHDLGDINADYDQDTHGISIHGNTENVWILYNTITKVSGDGVQIEAEHSRGTDKIHHIYMGKNIISGNKQSGLWIKHAEKVVISSNTIHDMVASNSSSGQCTGFQYSSKDFWFIQNTLYNCAQGIMAAGSDDVGFVENGSVYYIGNLIHNINSTNPTNFHQAGGLTLRMGGTNHFVVGNTIDDTDVALSAPVISGKLFVFNNIFSNRNEPTNPDIYTESISDNSEIDNNIFHPESSVKIRWGLTHNDLLSLKTYTSKCSECIDVDPKFINREFNNYNLTDDSPAINSGKNIDELVFTAFQETFNFDLSLDNDNFSVPVNAWDIGAFEKNEGITNEGITNKPLSPSILNIEVQNN